MRDIEKLEDIKAIVDEFYGKVRRDELLGPVFEERIGANWDKHLDTMYRFWQTILLDEGKTYYGNPFMKHATLPINQNHFETWLSYWEETLHDHHEGPKTDEAIWRAQKMGYVFQVKLFDVQNRGEKPLF